MLTENISRFLFDFIKNEPLAILGFTLLFCEAYDTGIPFCVALTVKTFTVLFLNLVLFVAKYSGIQVKLVEDSL